MSRSALLIVLYFAAWQPALARADDILTPAQASTRVGQTVTVYMKVKAYGSTSNGFATLISESTPEHVDAFLVNISTEAKESSRNSTSPTSASISISNSFKPPAPSSS